MKTVGTLEFMISAVVRSDSQLSLAHYRVAAVDSGYENEQYSMSHPDSNDFQKVETVLMLLFSIV